MERSMDLADVIGRLRARAGMADKSLDAPRIYFNQLASRPVTPVSGGKSTQPDADGEADGAVNQEPLAGKRKGMCYTPRA